ncbi:hypothetical protein ABZ612_41030 [Streptomyces avermitilis]|uniref:hypothetical protein n=1 Tax=Streptomyces avermitilis TaxID=33903 RepID=UPI0033CECB8D
MRHGAFGLGVATAVAIATVVVVALLTVWLAPGVLNLLSGAWPNWPAVSTLARRRATAHKHRRSQLIVTCTASGDFVVKRHAAVAALARRRYPKGAVVEATRIGNSVAATRQRVKEQYGLDLMYCWRPLTQVLDQVTYGRLVTASTLIVSRIQAMLSAAALLLWTPLVPTWPARTGYIAGCVTLVLLAQRAVAGAADAYSDAAEDAFCLHRIRLYWAMGFPPPSTSSAEPGEGQRLTDTLKQASLITVTFTWPNPLPASPQGQQ